ncbi:MAG: TetR/AcrR family transcriptional regulator [Thermoanaerobaculia bacterium]|nr:TetR/AcrR family transcriptional regulator [Thermoanaerobaculia bacterium]
MARIRKSSEMRRDELSAAALRILGERGLTALTTSALAQEVGLTSGALFRHFSTLDALLDEVVARAVKRVEETFPDPSGPAMERLLELAERRVRLLAAEPGISWMLRSEQALLSLPPEAVRQLRALAGRSRSFLIEALREGADGGTIRNDVDPEVLVIPVMGTIHMLAGGSGVAKRGSRPKRAEISRVLEGLKRMLTTNDCTTDD